MVNPEQAGRTAGLGGTVVVCSLILLLFLVGTIRRNQVWRGGPLSIWQDTVNKSPMKTRPRINLARALQQYGDDERAIQEYQNALMLAARLPRSQRLLARQLSAINLSQILIRRGDMDAAERVLVPVWNEEPGFPGIAANLAVIYSSRGNNQFAAEVIDAGISQLWFYPWFTGGGTLYANKAMLQRMRGECEEALKTYKIAARMDADLPRQFECPLRKEQ